MTPRVVVGISGASGAAIGLRIVDLLLGADIETDLIVTPSARRTIAEEIGPDAVAALERLPVRSHDIGDIGASIASGSVPTAGMIVAPCSMRTLSAIAGSLSDTLLIRAADVHLKERRPLVLLARETPLHLGHLRSMVAVTEMGAVVMPPVPAFYLKPKSIDDIVDQLARRVIDLLRIAPPTARKWED